MFLGILYEHWLVIGSCLIASIGPIAYIRSMIRGKAKPNLISRFLRGIIPLIGMGAALSAKADLRASIRVLLAGIMPRIIFCCAFFYKQSYWKLSTFDYICGFMAIIALVFWLIAKNPIIALWLTIIADCIASLPTVVKAWKAPETENGIPFIVGLLSAILIIPSIPLWNVTNAGFQIYLLGINVIIVFAIYRKKILGINHY